MAQLIILEDERLIASEGICSNCKHLKLVRAVDTFGWMRESRGYFRLCFDCLAPRIHWRKPRGKDFWSPVRNK